MAAKTIAFVNKNDAGSTVRTYNLPFGKYDATVAPGVNDDDTAGYIAGSKWVDRTNHNVYECKDNATGAAVWLLLGSLSDGTYGDIVVTGSGATWTIGSTMVQDVISLTDPGADRLAFWDDSAGHIAWLTLGTNLSITGTTIDAAGGGGGVSGTGTDNHIVRWDGTSAVQDSGVVIDDSDNITGVTSIDLAYAGLKLKDTGGQHMVIHPVCNTGTFAGDRVLQIGMPDANTTLTLGGDLTTSGSFTTTLTVTGNTNVTLPTSGTLITQSQADAAYQPIGMSASSRVLGRKTSGAGNTEECTLSEVLDFIGSAAQGDLLYRGASAWARLAAGTSGYFLKAQGAGANPTWSTVSASPISGYTSISVASTTDLSTASDVYVVLTSSGASAISSFGTAAAGTIRLVRSNAGNVQLVYNATSMILPGKADIYLKDGDEFWAVSEGSGNWRVAPYSRLTGRPIADSPAYSAPSGMRLSTESGVPLSIGNRTSQGTLYLCVDRADYLLIPKTDISDFDVWSPGQLSLSLTMTSGKVYDVFCWNNAGTPTLQLSSAWTDDFTRADALSTIKGVKVNDGTIGSMGSGRGIWLGTVRASGTNVTEISNALLGVWNKYNQRPIPLAVTDATSSWTYNSTTWRQANANTANKIQAVFGERQSNSVKMLWVNSNGSGAGGYGGIGINSTTTNSAQINNFSALTSWAAGLASYEAIQEPGFYSYNWLEAAQSGFNVTFLGVNSGGGNPTNADQTGIFGSIMG